MRRRAAERPERSDYACPHRKRGRECRGTGLQVRGVPAAPAPRLSTRSTGRSQSFEIALRRRSEAPTGRGRRCRHSPELTPCVKVVRLEPQLRPACRDHRRARARERCMDRRDGLRSAGPARVRSPSSTRRRKRATTSSSHAASPIDAPSPAASRRRRTSESLNAALGTSFDSGYRELQPHLQQGARRVPPCARHGPPLPDDPALAGLHDRVDRLSQEPRYAGKSAYTVGMLLRFAVDGLFFQTTTLLRWIVYVGFAISAVGVMLSAFFVVNYFVGDPYPGWTSLGVLLLLLARFHHRQHGRHWPLRREDLRAGEEPAALRRRSRARARSGRWFRMTRHAGPAASPSSHRWRIAWSDPARKPTSW